MKKTTTKINKSRKQVKCSVQRQYIIMPWKILPFFEIYRICGPLKTVLCTIALLLTSSSLAKTRSKFRKFIISAKSKNYNNLNSEGSSEVQSSKTSNLLDIKYYHLDLFEQLLKASLPVSSSSPHLPSSFWPAESPWNKIKNIFRPGSQI